MDYKFINGIEKMVVGLCRKKDWSWEKHIRAVVKYSRILARQYDADLEVVLLGAWLHDIAKLRGMDEHHIKGAELAEDILKGHKKTRMVQACIKAHSSKGPKPKTIEQKIIATADAMSHFDMFNDFSYHVYGRKKMSFDEGTNWLSDKFRKTYAKMMPQVRPLVDKQYECIKRLLCQR